MIHPGFLPILNLNEPGQTPLAEVISIYLEAELPHFLVSAGTPALLQELFTLREHMDFNAILPAESPTDLIARSLGVHLPAHADTVSKTRAVLGEKQFIVCFAGNYDDAALAEESGADAIIFGPVFGNDGAGISELEEACQTLSVPIFATGVIEAGNLLQLKDAGAYGFCVPELRPQDGNFEHEVAKLTALWEDFSEQR